VLNHYSPRGNHTIFRFLLVCKLLAAWFLMRLRDGHTRQSKANKAEILEQFASGCYRIGRLISNRFVWQLPS